MAPRPVLQALLVPFAIAGCRAVPPTHGSSAREGHVRAERPDDASRVAASLDELAPRVRALLPDTRERRVEVWVQEDPVLYRFPHFSYADADGLYVAGAGRIHLRRDAEHLDRTLAHELVHASLGEAWRTLPGTLEEGVCDVASAALCPDAAGSLRAGRLAAAAFATGGLVVELLAPRHGAGPAPVRIALSADPPLEIDPLEVFRARGGLAPSSLSPARKRALYGLAYLVVERIVERRGWPGLHALVARAEADERERVPEAWLLDAAGLSCDRESWRRALAEALGPRELSQLARLHAEVVPADLVGLVWSPPH